MSLLRRMDPMRLLMDWPGNAQFPLPQPHPDGDEEGWPLRWRYRAPGSLLSVAMTRDGQLLAAGSRSGHILFFDSTGRLLWYTQVEGAVHRLALAEEARCLLVGTAESGRAAYQFHFDGHLLRTFEVDSETWGIDLLPDASLIAVGALNQWVTVYDRAGTQVVACDVGGPVRHARFMSGGNLAIGTDDHRIIGLDRTGRILWQRQTEGRIWAGVCAAEQADRVFAGANDRCVYALDRLGNDRWSCEIGGVVNAVALTPDGQWCAAVSASNDATLFDESGQVIWEYSFDQPVYSVALSDDGRFMAMGVGDAELVVVDHADEHRMWTQGISGRVYALAMTPDGRTLVAATMGSSIHVFDNPVLTHLWQDTAERQMAHRLVSRAAIRQMRETYAHDSNAGLVRWFGEFERSLRGQQYHVCQALIDEIGDTRSYSLSEGEQQVIRSLEGARWLMEGIDHHRQGRIEAARECYERSKTIQASLNNRDGVGQAIAALSSLPAPAEEMVAAVAASDGSTPGGVVHRPVPVGEAALPDMSDDAGEPPNRAGLEQLLNEIAQKPRVLGMAEQLLEQRMIGAQLPEQLRIIALARRAGYLMPLLRGLQASERQVRAAASAALTFLRPGPDAAVITTMLQSPQSFVRWQAVRMVAMRAREAPEEFGRYKDQWWPLLLNPETFSTLDSLARREVALLVEEAGTGEDTAWLIAHLDDPDVDVRIAIVNALGKVGRREAIAAMKDMPDGTGFMGHTVAAAVTRAIGEIENRHPLPSVHRIYLSAGDPLSHRMVQESALFLADTDVIYGIVDLIHALPGTRLRVQWRQAENVLHEEHVTVTEDLPVVASVQELPTLPHSPDTPGRFGVTPGLSGARPGSPFATESPERPGSRPFGSSRRDVPQPRQSPFARPELAQAEMRPRPGASRPGTAPAQNATNERSERSGSRLFPFRRAEPPAAASPESSLSDRSSLFQRVREELQRPGIFAAPRRGLRSLFEDDELRRPGFRPFGRRPSGGPAGDLLENSEPGQETAQDRSERPANRPSAVPPITRPGSRPASPAPPAWLFTEGEEENPSSSGRPRRSPFGRTDDQGARGPLADAFRDRFRASAEASGEDQPTALQRGFRRTPRPGAVSRLAFVLSRPAEGWPRTPCQLEVLLESEQHPVSSSAEFRFVEVPRITQVEPGVMPDGRRAVFTNARHFLAGTQRIACRVRLDDAPVNTQVTGRCYWAAASAEEILLGEVCAQTRSEPDPSIMLEWDSSGWLTGNYRIEVEVVGCCAEPDAAPQRDQRQVMIALIERVEPACISLCHQVDEQNGPIGVGWPFVPGSVPRCMVEFDDPPPEMRVEAAWYGQQGLIHRAEPLVPAAEKGKRAVFELEIPFGQTLEPGFYSVVVEGDHITRRELSFEVKSPTWQQRIGPGARALWNRAKSLSRHLGAVTFLSVLGGVLLFGLALAGLDSVLGDALPANLRHRDVLLHWGDVVGGTGAIWALAWVAVGGGYSALYTRVRLQNASHFEQQVYRVVNLVLVYAGGGLLWYQLSYAVFLPGFVYPDTAGGILGSLRWIAPLLAWLALPMGMMFAHWYYEENNVQPFPIIGASVAIILVAVAVPGYVLALIAGAVAALLGIIPSGVLGWAGVDNRVIRAFIVVGANVGFVLGALTSARHWAMDFWGEWRDARSSPHSRKVLSLLDYSLEKIGIDRERWQKQIVLPGAVILTLAGGATIGLIVGFDSVVVPALKALYGPGQGEAFDRALRTSPGMTVALLALWLVWPGLVWAGYRWATAFGVEFADKMLVHRAGAYALGVWLSVPVMIGLVCETELVRGLSPEQTIFWADRIAVVMAGLFCAAWLEWTHGFLNTLDWTHYLPDSAEAWTLLSLMVLSVVVWPFWMWAAAIGLVLIVALAGSFILRYVT